jgi:hypothetical protein
MTSVDDRTLSYIENDIRGNSDEIRTLTKIVTENASAIKELLREVDRRQALMDDHEDRLRTLEAWKSRSMIYWSIAIGVGAALAYAIIPELIPFLAKSQQGAVELQHGVSQQTP